MTSLESGTVVASSTLVAPRLLLQEAYGELTQVLEEERIKRDEPLSNHTYVQVGGKADIAVFPSSFRQVREAILVAQHFGLPHWIMGNGSNLLVRDGGVRGLVIILTGLGEIRQAGEGLIAQGGAMVVDLARYALENHLSGLEFACGIPGTIGGGVRMNAGAYGGQLSDVLQWVRILTAEGEERVLEPSQLGLSYRESAVAREGWIVLEAAFTLRLEDKEVIQARMDDFTWRRQSKQPLEYPSCGSIFKRPPHDYAGRLIQAAGLQGLRVGGAEVSTKHAGFIVNVDQATATDFLSLIGQVQAAVKKKHGVLLELEVQVIGDKPSGQSP